MDHKLNYVTQLCKRVQCSLFDIPFSIRIERDNVLNIEGRIFLQIVYDAPCTKTKTSITWKGRKWYLSDYMSDDEIIKTLFTAFQMAVNHEVMEGFKVDNTVLFNPHVSYMELLRISNNEIVRI